jgi:hypothetical protein
MSDTSATSLMQGIRYHWDHRECSLLLSASRNTFETVRKAGKDTIRLTVRSKKR